MAKLFLYSSSAPPKLTDHQNPNQCSVVHSLSSNAFTSARLNPKTSSLSTSKHPKRQNTSLKCSQSDYYGQQQPSFATKTNDSPYPPQAGVGLSPRVFVGYTIYKGKAALTAEPRTPEFIPLDSGNYKLSKEGFVSLQFAPAASLRQYDWGRKQIFSLSVSEIGNLISLGARESCEFFHDPNKGRSDEGKVRKLLKVEPLPDGSGYFFNLSVQNMLINQDESILIPITKGEYAVLVSAFNFLIPYLLGWHTFANSAKPEDSVRGNNANPRFGGDYEWSR